MKNRFERKTDANHREVVDELRAVMPDATVFDLSGTGKGCPDIMLGWRGRNWLFEIKDGKKPQSARELTDAQREFHLRWQGQVAVVTSAAEAIAAIAREL